MNIVPSEAVGGDLSQRYAEILRNLPGINPLAVAMGESTSPIPKEGTLVSGEFMPDSSALKLSVFVYGESPIISHIEDYRRTKSASDGVYGTITLQEAGRFDALIAPRRLTDPFDSDYYKGKFYGEIHKSQATLTPLQNGSFLVTSTLSGAYSTQLHSYARDEEHVEGIGFARIIPQYESVPHLLDEITTAMGLTESDKQAVQERVMSAIQTTKMESLAQRLKKIEEALGSTSVAKTNTV